VSAAGEGGGEGLEALVASLEATYHAIDRELRSHSEAANRGERQLAERHRVEVERLEGVARGITARLAVAVP